MSNVTVSVDQLDSAIKDTLDNYDKQVLDSVKESAKKSMDKLVKDTKKTSPSKRVKRGITSKATFENAVGAEYVWYVKAPHYRLVHLLENGHATRNGGRTKAYHFIKNASDPIIEEYIKDVEEALKGD